MNTKEDSVLSKILATHQLEELAQLNVVEIITYLLTHLNERERDVISRRYGLKDGNKEILESIGKAHDLTRERVRQIEVSSLDKLRKMRDLDRIKRLKKIIIQIIEEHGGIVEQDYLFDVLVHFSTRGEGKRDGVKAHQNSFDFLLAKILNEDFGEISGSDHFKPSYKLAYSPISHLEDVVRELERVIESKATTMRTNEMIELIYELESYQVHQDRLTTSENIDLSGVLKSRLFEEDFRLVNSNKPLYSILRSAKNIEQNVFGHWGLYHWPEIKPRNINDKIYLILKHHGKTLHFADISKKINEIGFDKKKANIASTHNELILDAKYVLVGRGMYGLKEWGLKKGTVTEVIEEILNQEGRPLTKEEIIDKVMQKRMVKKATIILALGNKDKFKRIDDRYFLDIPVEEAVETEKA